jgi:hypothetical protein
LRASWFCCAPGEYLQKVKRQKVKSQNAKKNVKENGRGQQGAKGEA